MADYYALKAHLRGELIQPGDGNYDDARKLYNAMIDKKPAAIAPVRRRRRRDGMLEPRALEPDPAGGARRGT